MLNYRSLCPINLSLEVFGDRWTLLILRDIIFGNRRYFGDLIKSQEGISTNTLADRLKRLVDEGILTRSEDHTHKQKGRYSLTEKGIELLPILVSIGSWGRRFMPSSDQLSVRAEMLENGGAPLLERFMDELRRSHITGELVEANQTVLGELTRAYEERGLTRNLDS